MTKKELDERLDTLNLIALLEDRITAVENGCPPPLPEAPTTQDLMNHLNFGKEDIKELTRDRTKHVNLVEVLNVPNATVPQYNVAKHLYLNHAQLLEFYQKSGDINVVCLFINHMVKNAVYGVDKTRLTVLRSIVACLPEEW